MCQLRDCQVQEVSDHLWKLLFKQKTWTAAKVRRRVTENSQSQEVYTQETEGYSVNNAKKGRSYKVYLSNF